MHYFVLKKTVKSGGKSVRRWYYSYIDPYTGIKKQKVIPGCTSRGMALEFVLKLPSSQTRAVTIKTICKNMFVPGSDHMKRLEQLGRKLASETIAQYRSKIEYIIEEWGNYDLAQLTVPMVTNYLIQLPWSGAWKNKFLDMFTYIYNEAPFYGVDGLTKPNFPRFARNSKKADILTTEELSRFYNRDNWDNERDFLILLVIASFGLRIGEAMGIKTKQFIFKDNALVVDGFCKQDGTRTCYNKKGSEEDTKLRIAIGPSFTVNLVEEYIRIHALEPDDYVFQRKGGFPMRREYIEDVFEKQLQIAQIDKNGRKLVPHSLRFTYVTRLRRELPKEMVQKIVGHTSAEMTDYYTRAAIPEMLAGVKKAIPAADSLFN